MRLDKYMATYWPEYSRSTWQKFIEAGLVSVNGQIVSSVKHQLEEDDEVSHSTLPTTDASQFELPIIYQDEHVLVIDKPLGVLTHSKGEVNLESTVADFVRSRMSQPDDSNRPGIVHRLDRQTSGIIITAKDSLTKRHLQKQFQDRKAKKTYIAIVEGFPKVDEANIDLPIARHPKQPSQFRVDPNGKDAQTYYRVLARSHKYSKLQLKPVTGRTHQLRVHLAHLGTPIVGDTLYGAAPASRMFLHASQLEITIPPSHRQTFTSELPSDFDQVMS